MQALQHLDDSYTIRKLSKAIFLDFSAKEPTSLELITFQPFNSYPLLILLQRTLCLCP